jgi:Gas vesicle protein
LHSIAVMLEKVHPSRLTLAEVLDRVLDKGIVIDSRSVISVAGAELAGSILFGPLRSGGDVRVEVQGGSLHVAVASPMP